MKTRSAEIEKLSVTVAALEAKLSASEQERRAILQRGEQALSEANAREKETRKQFDDLKLRVRNLEIENARLIGYVDRVREDDIVREDLVATGEPDGEQQMVPKRKMRQLVAYNSGASNLGDENPDGVYHGWNGDDIFGRNGQPRPKPKHWVNY